MTPQTAPASSDAFAELSPTAPALSVGRVTILGTDRAMGCAAGSRCRDDAAEAVPMVVEHTRYRHRCHT